MKWVGTETTIEDCKAVLDNLSEITRVGLERAGLSREEVLEECEAQLNKGQGLTVWLDDALAGVFFWHWADDNEPPIIMTNSLWTPVVFGEGAAFMAVAMHNHLKKLQATYPDAIISALSYSPHRALDRWFKAVGFEPVPQAEEDGRLFAFRG